MGGAVADRELNRAVRFAVADASHEADIRLMLRENPMRGTVSVTFEREPNYFLAAGLAGGEDQTIVAYEDGRLVCVGRCTRRECWLNGRPQEVGYLAELRLDHAARRRFTIVRDGYQFFRERQGAGFHFTSIASDNERARRLLESGARGLPHYDFLDELATLMIAVPRHPRLPKLRVQSATEEDIPALLRLLIQYGQRHQLAAVWTDARLRSLTHHGLTQERFFLVREGGEVVACGALWDQRCFRQVVVQGYAGMVGAARPLLNAASRFTGRPPLPQPGAALAQAFLSPLALVNGAGDLLPEFIGALLPLAAASGLEWLTLALPGGDARLTALRRRFSTRTWASRLYRVGWPDQPAFEFAATNARFLPEVALL